MSQFFQIHQENPQARLIRQVVEIVRSGGVIVYPTDSAYALGCMLGNKDAVARMRMIRDLDKDHNFTLVCRDLSDISTYAKVDNTAYRVLKNHTPGAYTFILQGTKEVPKRFLHAKRKTIGLRIPEHPVAQALLAELGEPMLSSSLILPGDEFPMIDPYEIRQMLEKQVDLVIDGGYCGMELTTVIDMVDDVPVLLREGKGDPSNFTSLD
ncbi:MAG: threonylcarbamoyl-AMP synthase [Pseudomonadales bacterium]|nr:threonylcarbamoyl-AMP synthase [Pseudomonadales bacterium]